MEKEFNKKILTLFAIYFIFLFSFALPVINAEMPHPIIEVYNGSSINNDLNWINKSAEDTLNVNSSEYWNTNDGSIGGINLTQFENDGGLLHAVKSWWDGLYCQLTGCTMEGDIDMNGNDITNINKIYANDWSDISIYDLGDVHNSANDLNFLQYNTTGDYWHPVSIETTYYNATSYSIEAGTLDGGTLDNTRHPDGDKDGVTLNFSEDNAVPGLDVRVNFTDIDRFDRGIVRYKTSSLQQPYPYFQIYDYEGNKWEDYAQIVVTEDFRITEIPVFDDSDHIQNGVVQIRLYKETTGKLANNYYFDWMTISKGFGTPAGQEVDPIWENEKSDYYNKIEVDNNLSDYVPYTGATQTLELGNNWLTMSGNFQSYGDNKLEFYTMDSYDTKAVGDIESQITPTGWDTWYSSGTDSFQWDLICQFGYQEFGGGYLGDTPAHFLIEGLDSSGDYAPRELRIENFPDGVLIGSKVGVGFTGDPYGTYPTETLAVDGNIHLSNDNDKSLYGTGKDASIYYDGTNLHIDTQQVGTGTIILDNLPTSDPVVAGGVWNDGGTLKISSG